MNVAVTAEIGFITAALSSSLVTPRKNDPLGSISSSLLELGGFTTLLLL